MSYKIRTCKECGQKLHVRQIGRSLQIKNRCVHFDEIISATKLEEQTVPLDEFKDLMVRHEFPQLCIRHKRVMQFKYYLQRFTEIYHCPACKIVDDLMPTKHVKWWKKRSRNDKWQRGDVIWWHA